MKKNMASTNIIAKLKQANLLGRGGANFPTGLKWEAVKNIKAPKKYIICNGSEGEPSVFKDRYLFQRNSDTVIEGIKIALETIDHSEAYVYLNKEYYAEFKDKLRRLIKNLPIRLFRKSGGYIAGEESVICNAIAGERLMPRSKPPFPSEQGLFGAPTLINNVETFYWVARIAAGDYKNTRLYSISGDARNPGVYDLPIDYSVERILKETGNFPLLNFNLSKKPKFFVQTGGGAIGEILLPTEIKTRTVGGAGAIIFYDYKKTNLLKLMGSWAEFLTNGNCDKCVPCREGLYRLNEMLEKGDLDLPTINDLFFAMEETSFCALGKYASSSFKGVVNKLLK